MFLSQQSGQSYCSHEGVITLAFVRNPTALYFYVIHYICICSGCGRVHRACTLFYFVDLVLNSRTFRFYCSLLTFFFVLDCTSIDSKSLKCSSETWKKWSAGHISFNAISSFQKKLLIGVF
jgi:hypothetical protein